MYGEKTETRTDTDSINRRNLLHGIALGSIISISGCLGSIVGSPDESNVTDGNENDIGENNISNEDDDSDSPYDDIDFDDVEPSMLVGVIEGYLDAISEPDIDRANEFTHPMGEAVVHGQNPAYSFELIDYEVTSEATSDNPIFIIETAIERTGGGETIVEDVNFHLIIELETGLWKISNKIVTQRSTYF